jgi:hypothetical protein
MAPSGQGQDNHGHPPIVPPYQPATVIAGQVYAFSCPCVEGEQMLGGPYTLMRTISQRPDGAWKYVITKAGVTATADPLQ